jgi:hypothetical protein
LTNAPKCAIIELVKGAKLPSDPLTNAPKWGIIGVVSRENPFDPLTNAPEMGYNRGGFKGKSL